MGQIPSVVVPPTRTQRLNAPSPPSASDQDCAAFFDPWRSGTLRHISRPVGTLRGLIGSVRGTSLLPATANLCTQSNVMGARARGRPRAPKVGSPASTLLRSNRALESVIEWAETTKRGDLSIECDQILPELFILTGDLLPQRRRVLSFPWGRGAGRQAVARARRGLHGNQLPAQIQRARRHVSLLIPRRPSGLVCV